MTTIADTFESVVQLFYDIRIPIIGTETSVSLATVALFGLFMFAIVGIARLAGGAR